MAHTTASPAASAQNPLLPTSEKDSPHSLSLRNPPSFACGSALLGSLNGLASVTLPGHLGSKCLALSGCAIETGFASQDSEFREFPTYWKEGVC